jgi:hypothetical protein
VISEVLERHPQVLKHALLRELDRRGQTFLVHNRIETLPKIAAELQALVPSVRVVIGHGQMEASELHRAMKRSRAGTRRRPRLDHHRRIGSTFRAPTRSSSTMRTVYGLAELHQLRRPHRPFDVSIGVCS